MSETPTQPDRETWKRFISPPATPRRRREGAFRSVTISRDRIVDYFESFGRTLRNARATHATRGALDLGDAFSWVASASRYAHDQGNKLIFIGNGGSAAIASHMAIDASKDGNLRSLALNDGAAITCLGQDLGYERIFSQQIEMHARPGDLITAISSSGDSENILRAVQAARERDCLVVTLSGASPDNPLRVLGHLNFWVDSSACSHVELSHLALCQAILDLATPA